MKIKTFLAISLFKFHYESTGAGRRFSRQKRDNVKGWWVDENNNRKLIADDWDPETNLKEAIECLVHLGVPSFIEMIPNDGKLRFVCKLHSKDAKFSFSYPTLEQAISKAIASSLGMPIRA